MLDGRQLGNADPEQLASGDHEGPEPRAEGEVPEQPIGGDPIIHLEVGTGEHVRGQELAGAENWRRLKRRLRQGRGSAVPETDSHHSHRSEGHRDDARDAFDSYHKSPPCAAIIDSACRMRAANREHQRRRRSVLPAA
jgi:hypothetical protein